MAPRLRRKKIPPTHKHKVKEDQPGKCVICGQPAAVPPWDFRSTDCGGLFTINDVLKDPQGCRNKCTAEFFDEKVCQVLLKDMYSTGKRCPPLDDDRYKACLDESHLERTYSDGVQVARTHKMIADIILESPLGENFESFWTTMPLEHRRDAIFQSLDNALRPYRSFERRLTCPDLSGALAEEGAFVDLVRHITYSGIKYQGQDYLPVPSQEFEYYYRMDSQIDDLPSNRAARAYQAAVRHARNRAIANFVLELLHKWYLRNPPQVIAGAVLQKPRKIICCVIPSSRFDNPAKNVIYHELHHESESETETQDGEEELKDPYREICRCCRRAGNEILEFDNSAGESAIKERNVEKVGQEDCARKNGSTDSKKGFWFLHCSICLKLGRRIPYCSKDCQQADWKNHKIFCNKRFTDLHLPFAGEHPPSSVPLPSFSLLWQMSQRGKESSFAVSDFPPKPEIVLYRIVAEDPRTRTPPSYTEPIKFMTIVVQDQTRHLLPLMDRAVETRSEQDVAHFFREFAAIFFLRDYSFDENVIDQLSKDWEIERAQVEVWVSEGWDIGFERGVAKLRLGIASS
ncbi:hypothetical protein JCM3765_005171 [Sporobolomyces pararoseus]